MSLSQEDVLELTTYVECVFNRWWGLQAAIQNSMGSNPVQTKNNVRQMIAAIVKLCAAPQIAKENLSDELEDLAWKYFSTEFEDESPEEVAQLLWSESRDFLAGNRDKIRSFVEGQLKSPLPCVKLNPQSDDDTDDEVDEKMDTDSAETVRQGPDEDGWEVVTGRRKKQ